MKKVVLLAGCMAVACFFMVNMAHAGDEGCMETVKGIYSDCVKVLRMTSKNYPDRVKIVYDDCNKYASNIAAYYSEGAEKEMMQKVSNLCCENMKSNTDSEEVFGQLQSLCK